MMPGRKSIVIMSRSSQWPPHDVRARPDEGEPRGAARRVAKKEQVARDGRVVPRLGRADRWGPDLHDFTLTETICSKSSPFITMRRPRRVCASRGFAAKEARRRQRGHRREPEGKPVCSRVLRG